MKKIFIFGLLVISVFLITGCNKSNEIKSDIVSFKYYYGSGEGSIYEYTLSLKEDKVVFTAKGYNDVNLNIEKEIDKSYLKELANIINENKIYEWNGFNKHNKDVLDGYGFYLEVNYENGEVIKANGYMEYPKNYDKSDKVLTAFLESIE